MNEWLGKQQPLKYAASVGVITLLRAIFRVKLDVNCRLFSAPSPPSSHLQGCSKDLSITKDTFNWYVGLRDRADDPSALPNLRIIFADVPTKPTIAQKAIEEEALRLFPIMDNYFMHRNQHLDADAGGFLHDIANLRRESKYGLLRTHAKHFDEAVEEAHDILEEILGDE